MNESFIYLWYDSRSKMFYLGKHKGTPDDKYTHSARMWEHFDKNNIPKGVRRRILAYGTDEEMSFLENQCLVNRKARCWDKYYNTGLGNFKYIDQSGENNPMWGVTQSEETREKKSQAMLIIWQTDRKGWKQTDEMKQHLSDTMKKKYENGYVNPNTGIPCKEETKEKLRIKATGRKASQETKDLMSKQRSGPNGQNVRSGITFAPIKEQRKHFTAMNKKRRNASDATREAYNKYMREYNARMTKEQKDKLREKKREWRKRRTA